MDSPSRRRAGVSPRGCLIAIAAFVAIVVAAIAISAFLLNNLVAGLTARPIDLPPITDPEKVRQALDQKIEHVVGPPGAASPAAEPPPAAGTTLMLSSDETNLLLRQVLPPELGASMHVTITGDEARILAPVKGSVFAQLLPAQFSMFRSYVSGLNYLNLDMRAKVKYADGKWELLVREIKQPFKVGEQQARKTAAEVMAGRSEQVVRIPLGKTEVTLVSLELKDDQAFVKVRP